MNAMTTSGRKGVSGQQHEALPGSSRSWACGKLLSKKKLSNNKVAKAAHSGTRRWETYYLSNLWESES